MLKTSKLSCRHGTAFKSINCVHHHHQFCTTTTGSSSSGTSEGDKPKFIVDVTPNADNYWKDKDGLYPWSPTSLVEFLRKQRDDFNHIQIPEKLSSETQTEYEVRRDTYLHALKSEAADEEDVKAVFSEWYLRQLEENKWNHFLNQMVSTRYTKPYDWDNSDPIPDWAVLHGLPSDPNPGVSSRLTAKGRALRTSGDRNLRELTAEGNTSIGDFEVEYAASLANRFSDDLRPPYLPQQLQTLNENKQLGWQELTGSLPEFYTHSNMARTEFQFDDEQLPWVPPNYYDPTVPLPAYRNHEALLTADPRNPKYVDKGTSLEDEKAMMIKQGVKPHKRVQDATGVAYTPDFDFDLWAEDMHRPLHITNTYGFVPRKLRKAATIQRTQLPQRKRMLTKSFTPTWDNLIEFNWKSRMTRHQYLPSRMPTFHVIKIAGNARGCAGLGIGRAKSFLEAAKKAEYAAAANMIYVPRYRNHSIASTLYGKFHSFRVYIVPKPMGYGERGPPIVKAICHAFGIRDFCARYEGKQRVSNWTKIRAIWNCFLRATNPAQDCEDRGQRLVEAYPEADGYAYQLPRGYAHDMVVEARNILEKHQTDYADEEDFEQYSLSPTERKQLPMWIVDEPPNFWEGGLPDISGYEWRADLIDILNQKGPAGIPKAKEAQIQRLLAEKVDPCDHHFRWMKCMIQVAPNQALGM